MTKNRKRRNYRIAELFFFYMIWIYICIGHLLPNIFGGVGGSPSIIYNNVSRLRRVNNIQKRFYISNQKFASYEELKQIDSESNSIFSTHGYNKWYDLKIIIRGNITLILAQWKEIPFEDYKLQDIITGLKYNQKTQTFISTTCLANNNVSNGRIDNPTKAIIFNQSEAKCEQDLRTPNDIHNDKYIQAMYLLAFPLIPLTIVIIIQVLIERLFKIYY